jgi:hypothetical protein
MNSQIAALDFISHSINPNYKPETLRTLRSLIEYQQIYWEDVAFLANINLVTPLLWVSLREKGLINALPEDFCAYLAELHRQNTVRNTHILQQLLEIAQALNRHEIVPVVLKGAAYLLTATFPDSGARIMNDLDLLVPKKHFPLSIEVLQTLGYDTKDELKEKYRNHHHYAPLLRPGEFASVDLHHTLLYKTAEKMLPTNTAWKQIELLEIQGAHLQVLSPTYRLLHNILHSEIVDRNYQKGIIPLRELSDLVYTQYHYKQKLDWPLIETTLLQHGKQNILYSYLYLACRYLGMSFPEPMEPNLASRIHYQRCRSKVRWTWFMKLDSHLQGFSSYHICQLYGYPNTPSALIIGRLRYAVSIIRKCIRHAVGKSEKSMP